MDGSGGGVTVFLPSGDLGAHSAEVGDPAGQALAAERAQLDLGDVKPTAVFGMKLIPITRRF